MAEYQYTSKDKNGSSIKGIIEAASEADAAEILHNRDLIVLTLTQMRRKAFSLGGDKRVKSDELVVFSRQLATMVDTGIPLVQALGILSEQIETPAFKKVIMSVRQDIESGMSFYESLGKHPKIFSELFVNMSKAGEASGTLDEVLDRLATYLEKSAALARKIKASMVYPIVVVSMAIIITTVLLLKVVPTFKGIFEILGGQLPLPTRILIGISDALGKYFFALVGIILLSIYAYRRYGSTEKGRLDLDNRALKLPAIGQLVRKIAVAKFSRTFSTLVRSGVSILNSLEIVAKTAGNKVIENAILDCRNAVREGEPISKPLGKSGIFPPMVVRMISIGEQTGQLEKMLSKIADFYDEQVDAAVSGLTSIIEPLVIAFLGVVIGGIVIALFMPIFKITELIGK